MRMIPWYKGFTGEINPTDDQLTSFTVLGRFNRISHNKFEITELPIQKWTRDFKNSLEVMA
jgi:DNA topoisomerase-2